MPHTVLDNYADTKYMKAKDCFSVATQTDSDRLLPTKTGNSIRSSVRRVTESSQEQLVDENECLKQALAKTKLALAESQMERDSLLHRIKHMSIEHPH